MSEFNPNGVGVALVTPFRADGSIDFNALENVIQFVIEGGCDYIVTLGTTAETPTLSLKERYDLAEFVKEKTAGKIPLVIGVGGNCTRRVVEDISYYNLDGFQAILSVTPYYNRPTQEGIFQHYKTIADNSPIPVILYNVPGRTGVNLSASTTIKLAELSPKICAIKEASGNIAQCEKILENAPVEFKLISGDDAITSALMKKGACGVISVLANAFPKEVKRLIQLCGSRDWEEAEKAQEEMAPLIRIIFEEGNPAGIKAVLAELGLIKNYLRLPLVRVSKKVEEEINYRLRQGFCQ